GRAPALRLGGAEAGEGEPGHAPIADRLERDERALVAEGGALEGAALVLEEAEVEPEVRLVEPMAGAPELVDRPRERRGRGVEVALLRRESRGVAVGDAGRDRIGRALRALERPLEVLAGLVEPVLREPQAAEVGGEARLEERVIGGGLARASIER